MSVAPVFKDLALLTDDAAVRVARRAAVDKLSAGAPQTDLPDDLRAALQDAFGVGPVPRGSAGPATAARYALAVLAEADPAAVEGYLRAGEAEALGTLAALTAALVILQTEVKVERSKDGRWSVTVHKSPASDGLLKSFVRAVLGLG